MAAWSVFLGFAAILLVFRTTDWRGLMHQAQEDQDGENGGGEVARRGGDGHGGDGGARARRSEPAWGPRAAVTFLSHSESFAPR